MPHALRAFLLVAFAALATILTMHAPTYAGTAVAVAHAAPIVAAAPAPSAAPTPDTDPCRAAAWEMHVTQDYTGTDRQVECFGEEDSARTELALTTGTTIDQWYLGDDGHMHRLYDV